MAIKLPTKPLPKVTQDPKNLIIYGSPKSGKTTVLSTLEDNLIVDFEDGSDYVEALKVKIHDEQEFRELLEALGKSEHKYKFITIDTITALEDFSKPMALAMYRKTPAGKGYNGDILYAPNGIGYSYIRDAMFWHVDKLKQYTTNIIIVAHVKDKAIATTDGKEEGSIRVIDLYGKSSNIFSAKSDAIAFVHRDKDSNLCLNFKMDGSATVGARPEHLANQDIIVAERQEDGTFVSHWERIYPSLAK